MDDRPPDGDDPGLELDMYSLAGRAQRRIALRYVAALAMITVVTAMLVGGSFVVRSALLSRNTTSPSSQFGIQPSESLPQTLRFPIGNDFGTLDPAQLY